MRGRRQEIRYSEAFKMEVVRELESEGLAFEELALKYGIKGKTTVSRWVRQYGNGTRGKVIRVEKADEVNEAGRLRKELRRVKEALADAHVELALEKAFLEVACEQLNQPLEVFKKKQAGRRRTKP